MRPGAGQYVVSGFGRTLGDSRRDEEAAPARRGPAHELKTGDGMLRSFDHDMLQKIAEARLDRPLIARVRFEIVSDGAPLIDLAVCLHEHGTRGIAVAGACRVQLFERRQTCLEAGEILLAAAD